MGGFDSGPDYDEEPAAEKPLPPGYSVRLEDFRPLRDDEKEAIPPDVKGERIAPARIAAVASIRAEGRVTVRIDRGRPVINALGLLLPTQDRERWTEEWMAEWVDLGSRPRRTRMAFLLRVALRSGPHLAWTLRQTRRQRAQ